MVRFVFLNPQKMFFQFYTFFFYQTLVTEFLLSCFIMGYGIELIIKLFYKYFFCVWFYYTCVIFYYKIITCNHVLINYFKYYFICKKWFEYFRNIIRERHLTGTCFMKVSYFRV